MKKYRGLLLFILICFGHCFGQEGQFRYPKRLVYNDSVIGNLRHIVDSMNKKFKKLASNAAYYSQKQAMGNFIKMDSGAVDAAKKDLDNNISFDDFCARYPKVVVQKKHNVLPKSSEEPLVQRKSFLCSLLCQLHEFQH